MKSTVENAKISFREQLARLKAITGMNNKDVAKMLGCTPETISRAYENPFAVRGEYILMIQEYLKKEERARYA